MFVEYLSHNQLASIKRIMCVSGMPLNYAYFLQLRLIIHIKVFSFFQDTIGELLFCERYFHLAVFSF